MGSFFCFKNNAEVNIDPFADSNNINNWVSDKTFKLINNLVDDVNQNDFFLINALAIDMNWNNQIHCTLGHQIPCVDNGIYKISYAHEKIEDDATSSYKDESVPYEKGYDGSDGFPSMNFDGKSEVSNGLAEANVDKYLDKYINDLKENYEKSKYNTDFLVYEDDNVKSFAKDLKEYDGTTLQYVGIMPKKDDLNNYINNVKANDLNNIIENLKEMKIENFKDGVATIIRGNIPFFKFEYELQLMEDLQKLGIKKVFTKKADLSNMVDGPATINKAIHKANIEFSNDEIKAAAATIVGGFGGTSGGFDYLYKIPVEKIDITFNKPYMFIIRDKNSKEVWFTGTVYEPIEK